MVAPKTDTNRKSEAVAELKTKLKSANASTGNEGEEAADGEESKGGGRNAAPKKKAGG